MSDDARTDFFTSGDTPDSAAQDARTAFFASPPPSSPTQTISATGLKGAAGDLALKYLTGFGSSIIGGYQGIRALVQGEGMDAAANAVRDYQAEHTYQPAAGSTADVLGKPADAILNAPGALIKHGSELVQESGFDAPTRSTGMVTGPSEVPVKGATGKQFVSPLLATAVETAANAVPMISGLKGTNVPLEGTPVNWRAPEVAPVSAPKPFAAPEVSGVKVDSEPVDGGLPKEASGERAAILKRVGLENARNSALEGDAKSAATDWQLSKFDEPAGVAAKAQFDAERQALSRHSEGIVEKTGGTLGTDEDSLNTRGQTIAKPFDALSDWFDQQRKALYSAADARGGGAPVTQLQGVDALLKDPSFRNSLLAKDQGNLLSGIQGQLEEFRKQNPNGFNVQGAEQVRQWLNQVWTNDNKWAIGRVKDALDDDVMKGAGEDLYGPARQLSRLKQQTLDNPNGVSSLMERDPQTPINRTTPFEKIPDAITRMPVAQFQSVLNTLKGMPDEIRPEADAAIGEIKAQLANKIHDAGNSTAGQWNAKAVSKVIAANKAKLSAVFSPEELQSISDLESAGKILKVDQSYPGAAAQASNALKRGLMSRALSSLGATAGAGAGSVLGPFGAAGGAAVGEAAGSKLGGAVSERAAVKRWQSKVSSLSDQGTPSP